MEILTKIVNGILDAIFPVRCTGCGKEGWYICEKCEGFLSENALICPACGQSSLTGVCHEKCKTRYGLDGLTSMWEFDGVLKLLVHEVKYNGVTHAVKEIVEKMMGVAIEDSMRFGDFLLFSQSAEYTWVPMFRKKERTRGFNQAMLIAKEFAKYTKGESANLLVKARETKDQADLKREERLQNVRGVFCVKAQNLSERVVLVDDVWTTGATMRECCAVLKKAGAKEVWGLTIARTV